MQGDDILTEKAKEVALGKFSVAGQKIVINRNTVLSRLSACGISTANVQISGAESTEVRRREKTIATSRFTELADSFLRSRLKAADSISSIRIIKKPQLWAGSPDGGDVKLTAKMGKHSSSGKPKVWVSVIRDGVEVDRREVLFEIRYKRQKAVAVVDIPAGVMISPKNVKVVKFESSSPATADFTAPYGRVARMGIRKGRQVNDTSVVRMDSAKILAPVVVIKRRQIVMAEIRRGGMFISMQGEALTDGKVGEYIRVKMGSERNARVIYAKVKQDGTVEPNF
jgi:flagella basal body P-ring formation protein FlgA